MLTQARPRLPVIPAPKWPAQVWLVISTCDDYTPTLFNHRRHNSSYSGLAQAGISPSQMSGRHDLPLGSWWPVHPWNR